MSNNPFKKLWDTIKGWVDKNAGHYLFVTIPKDRTDADYDDSPLEADRSYFRLWLNEMFLTKSREWFSDWHPAVHSSVQLKFGDYDNVNLSRVARAPENKLSQAVLLNYTLTELVPFRGGTVEIEAGLLALKGKDYLQTTIKLLQEFSGLIAAPLSQALNIAEKVSSGMQDVLAGSDGEVHLALHQAFTSAGGGQNDLRPGYFAVIKAEASNIASDRLYVKESKLYYAAAPGAQPQPLAGYDYMLFRIEGRKERDDWRLKNIQEPLDRAMEAILQGEDQKAKAYRMVAITNAFQSPDLAVYDRRRVVQAIKDELAEIQEQGLGAVGGATRSLNKIVSARAMPVKQAAALGEMSFEEAIE
jgi:hypothetical protein